MAAKQVQMPLPPAVAAAGHNRQGTTHLWIEVLVAAVQGDKQHTVVLPEHPLGAVAVVNLRVRSTAGTSDTVLLSSRLAALAVPKQPRLFESGYKA
jgi:hypothetical protein